MRHALVLLALLLPGAPQEEWKAERKDVRIPMRDGKRLAADLYLPPKAGKYPVVLIQTPYAKRTIGAPIGGEAGEGGETGRGSVSDMRAILDRDNYVYCVVDWRGFFGSKEAQDGVDRTKWRRGQDGYDAVEWLAAQDFCDGKVGTWGGSALGKQQFDTAAEKPPHLVCAVPLIAYMGQRYGSYYEGGVPLESHIKTLDALGFGVGDFVLKHPDPKDGAWKFVERLTYRPDAVDVPCLLISGWWDNFPADILANAADLWSKGGAKAREHTKLMMGPWDHVSIGISRQGDLEFPGAEKASADAARAFFDRWLRGIDNGWDKTPRVRWWQCGEEKWMEAAAWTGVKREARILRPGADGRLGREEKAGERTYVADPRKPAPTLGGANLPPVPHGPRDQSALDKRADVLVYSTGPLEAPLRLGGAPTLELRVTADRPSFDVVARLCEGREDGKSMLICEGAVRASGGRVTIPLSPNAFTIPKGRSLKLYVSSTAWPRYGRNPHTGEAHFDPKTAVEANIVVHHDGAALNLPVLLD